MQAPKASITNENYMWDEAFKALDPIGPARALARLERVAERLTGFGSRILICMTNNANILIDAHEHVRLHREAGAADLKVEMTPQRLIELIDRELEPRSALQFGYMRIEGDPLLAIRFGDAISGQPPGFSRPLCENLPQPTHDIERAVDDVRTFGYCIVEDALTAEGTEALRRRLWEQEQAEIALGTAMRDGGPDTPNIRLWSLINKGQEFEDLLLNPVIPAICIPLLGENFILGSYTSNTAAPGCEPQVLHYDQSVHQPSPPIRMGLNFAFCLHDVTDENGGTRILPGSHLWTKGPADPYSIEGTIALEATKGSALVWDTRVWHGTGPNRSQAKRSVILPEFFRYYVRSNQNFSLTLAPEVEARLSDEVKTMLGFRVTGRIGVAEEVVEGKIVTRSTSVIGRLRPQDVADRQ